MRMFAVLLMACLAIGSHAYSLGYFKKALLERGGNGPRPSPTGSRPHPSPTGSRPRRPPTTSAPSEREMLLELREMLNVMNNNQKKSPEGEGHEVSDRCLPQALGLSEDDRDDVREALSTCPEGRENLAACLQEALGISAEEVEDALEACHPEKERELGYFKKALLELVRNGPHPSPTGSRPRRPPTTPAGKPDKLHKLHRCLQDQGLFGDELEGIKDAIKEAKCVEGKPTRDKLRQCIEEQGLSPDVNDEELKECLSGDHSVLPDNDVLLLLSTCFEDTDGKPTVEELRQCIEEQGLSLDVNEELKECLSGDHSVLPDDDVLLLLSTCFEDTDDEEPPTDAEVQCLIDEAEPANLKNLFECVFSELEMEMVN